MKQPSNVEAFILAKVVEICDVPRMSIDVNVPFVGHGDQKSIGDMLDFLNVADQVETKWNFRFGDDELQQAADFSLRRFIQLAEEKIANL